MQSHAKGIAPTSMRSRTKRLPCGICWLSPHKSFWDEIRDFFARCPAARSTVVAWPTIWSSLAILYNLHQCNWGGGIVTKWTSEKVMEQDRRRSSRNGLCLGLSVKKLEVITMKIYGFLEQLVRTRTVNLRDKTLRGDSPFPYIF